MGDIAKGGIERDGRSMLLHGAGQSDHVLQRLVDARVLIIEPKHTAELPFGLCLQVLELAHGRSCFGSDNSTESICF